jgi:hypothetical protein
LEEEAAKVGLKINEQKTKYFIALAKVFLLNFFFQQTLKI